VFHTRLPAWRASDVTALHSRGDLASAIRIHGPHLGIGVGIGLLHSVDVILEGDLLAIAGPIRVASFIGHIEVGQLLLLAAVRVHGEDVELVSTLAIGSKRDAGSIGGPHGVGIVCAAGELPQAGAVEVHHVDFQVATAHQAHEHHLIIEGPSGLDTEQGIRQDGVIAGTVGVHDSKVGHWRLVGLRGGEQPCVYDLGAVGRPTRSDVEPRGWREAQLACPIRADHIDRAAIEIALIRNAVPVWGPGGIVFRLRIVGQPGGVAADTGEVDVHEVNMVD